MAQGNLRISRVSVNGDTERSAGAQRDFARGALIIVEVLLAAGAIPGGVLLVLNPRGGGPMQFDIEYLQGTPFGSYIIPGFYLAGLVGGGALAAAFLAARRATLAPYLSALLGLLMISFEAVELMIIPFSILQAVYLCVGVAIVGLASRLERDDAAVVALLRRGASLVTYRSRLSCSRHCWSSTGWRSGPGSWIGARLTPSGR